VVGICGVRRPGPGNTGTLEDFEAGIRGSVNADFSGGVGAPGKTGTLLLAFRNPGAVKPGLLGVGPGNIGGFCFMVGSGGPVELGFKDFTPGNTDTPEFLDPESGGPVRLIALGTLPSLLGKTGMPELFEEEIGGPERVGFTKLSEGLPPPIILL
jgi:hypothetical protein